MAKFPGGLYGDSDPIAALATSPAESALAVIRTSGGGGEGALRLLSRVFSRPGKLLSVPPNSVVHGWILEPENPSRPEQKKIDEVLVSVYRAPKSYTGEDGADISCHGGSLAARGIMGALREAGFRDALPGEFTFRAFMNGKLDLTRAESVMEIVAAKTGYARERAVRRLSGALEREIQGVKKLLVEVLSGVEIFLDYSEDEFAFSSSDEEEGRLPERALAEEAEKILSRLSELWSREKLYAEGALAVIAGRPNAGKSSLFNCLVREDRSIVTATPGTTRDWIEALVSAVGIPLRLVDTAGLRAAGEGSADEAERVGIERSFDIMNRADLVIYVFDGSEGFTPEDWDFISNLENADGSLKPVVIVRNKADLPEAPKAASSYEEAHEEAAKAALAVSAKTGEGVPALLRAVAACLTEGTPGVSVEEEYSGPGTARQKELIDAALASVTEALSLSGRGEPLDIIAPFFRAAIDALGEITGEVSSADILEAMFSRFCVGK